MKDVTGELRKEASYGIKSNIPVFVDLSKWPKSRLFAVKTKNMNRHFPF